MIYAGQLRHRLAIQHREDSFDDDDNAIDSWVTDHVVWASVREGSSRNTIIERSAQTESAVLITMRYLRDLDSEMQLTDVCGSRSGCNGKHFSILGIADVDGRRRELTITAQTFRQLSGAEL